MKVYDIARSLRRHPTKRFRTRDLSRINKLIVHHSATLGGSAEAYARYHVDNNGWPGIGYHFVIDKDGRINQTNDLATVSYHVSGQNTSAVGICCTGHYDQQTPPAAQIASLVWLLRELKRRLPNAQIKGHRDYSSKTCPGNNFPFRQVVDAVNRPGSAYPPIASNPSTAPAPAPGGSGSAGALMILPIGAALWWLLR